MDIYIEIDGDRFQSNFANNKKALDSPILVDCQNPSNYYKLKTDYADYAINAGKYNSNKTYDIDDIVNNDDISYKSLIADNTNVLSDVASWLEVSQWELDATEELSESKKALISQLETDLDTNSAECTMILRMKDSSRISSSEYNSRKAELDTALENIYTQFDTDMGAL